MKKKPLAIERYEIDNRDGEKPKTRTSERLGYRYFRTFAGRWRRLRGVLRVYTEVHRVHRIICCSLSRVIVSCASRSFIFNRPRRYCTRPLAGADVFNEFSVSFIGTPGIFHSRHSNTARMAAVESLVKVEEKPVNREKVTLVAYYTALASTRK